MAVSHSLFCSDASIEKVMGRAQSENKSDLFLASFALRRDQSVSRAAFVCVCAIAFWPLTSIEFAIAWAIVCTAAQAFQFFVMTSARRLQWSGSRIGRVGLVVLVLGQGTLFSSFPLAAAANQSLVGVFFAVALLSAALMSSTMASQGSRDAFLAMATPSILALVGAIPVLLIPSIGVGGAVVLALAGLFEVGAVVALWRMAAGLLLAEKAARLESDNQRQRAEAAVEAKSAFVAAVSHELRTPVSAILAGAGALRRSASAPTDRNRADLVLSAGSMMRTLLNDLLDLSKIQAGRMGVEAIPFDLRALLCEALAFWGAEARARGVRLRLVGASTVPQWVVGDPTRLTQILNNLFSNALKFTPSGSVTLRLSRLGDVQELSVTDTGAGMTADQLSRLFVPFAQADGTIARTHGGTGLGLSISRDLAQLMGGDLTAASQNQEGSTFSLRIPLPTTQPGAGEDRTDAVSETTTAMLVRILVVDDHEVNRQAITLMLEPIGATVAVAESGQQALTMLETDRFDIVLLDVNMPGLSGLDVARRIRAEGSEWRETPIIAVTGSASSAETARCLEAGMDRVVAKPIKAAELYAALSEMLVEPEIIDQAIGALA